MSFKWPNKDPDETLDYSIDWSRFLGYDHANSSGTTISSNKWFVDDADGVKTELNAGADHTVNALISKVVGMTATSTVCTVRFSAGTVNTVYKITSQITGTDGLVSERVVRLRIKEN
jgi:hypothetical protein